MKRVMLLGGLCASSYIIYYICKQTSARKRNVTHSDKLVAEYNNLSVSQLIDCHVENRLTDAICEESFDRDVINGMLGYVCNMYDAQLPCKYDLYTTSSNDMRAIAVLVDADECTTLRVVYDYFSKQIYIYKKVATRGREKAYKSHKG